MKIAVFQDDMPCRLIESCQFQSNCCFCHQGRRGILPQEGNVFVQNVENFLPDQMAFHPGRWQSSCEVFVMFVAVSK